MQPTFDSIGQIRPSPAAAKDGRFYLLGAETLALARRAGFSAHAGFDPVLARPGSASIAVRRERSENWNRVTYRGLGLALA